MSVADAAAFFDRPRSSRRTRRRSPHLILTELRSRLRYLLAVGLDYLTLDRQSRTLSGGELARVDLTRAVGSSLVNTLYILDEPSVGLHPRDSQRLVKILQELRAKENTVVVVEHEQEIIREADHIIDLGPGAGEHGGDDHVRRAVRELLAERALGDGALSHRPPAHPGAGEAAPRRCATSSSSCAARARTTCAASTCTSRCAAWSASPACPARASRR